MAKEPKPESGMWPAKPPSFAHNLEWGIRGINPNTYNIADRVFDWFHDRRAEGRREKPTNG